MQLQGKKEGGGGGGKWKERKRGVMNALGHVFTVKVKRLKIEIHWGKKTNKKKQRNKKILVKVWKCYGRQDDGRIVKVKTHD